MLVGLSVMEQRYQAVSADPVSSNTAMRTNTTPSTTVILPSPSMPLRLTVPKTVATLAQGRNDPSKTRPPPMNSRAGPALVGRPVSRAGKVPARRALGKLHRRIVNERNRGVEQACRSDASVDVAALVPQARPRWGLVSRSIPTSTAGSVRSSSQVAEVP